MSSTPTLTLEVDGRSYVLRPKEVDAFKAATFRAATGTSVEGLLAAIDTSDDGQEEPGLVEVAQFLYLAALQEGTGETFEEIASTVTYDSDFGAMRATGIPTEDDDEDGLLLEEPPEPEDEEEEGPPPVDPPLGLVGFTPDESASSPNVAESS